MRCFTCGKVLADKYDYYIKEALKLEQTQASAQPPKRETKKAKEAKERDAHETRHFDALRTGPLMDNMGLTRYCCRRHMLATVDMMDII